MLNTLNTVMNLFFLFLLPSVFTLKCRRMFQEYIKNYLESFEDHDTQKRLVILV